MSLAICNNIVSMGVIVSELSFLDVTSLCKSVFLFITLVDSPF